MLDRLGREARDEKGGSWTESVQAGTAVVGGAVVGWSASWALTAALLHGSAFVERHGGPAVLVMPMTLWIGVPAAALGLPAAVMKGGRATGRWRDYSIAVRAAFIGGMLAALALVAAYLGVGPPRG